MIEKKKVKKLSAINKHVLRKIKEGAPNMMDDNYSIKTKLKHSKNG